LERGKNLRFAVQNSQVTPALGRYAKSTSTTPNPKQELTSQELAASLTVERFALQAAARYLLPGERVANCLRRRQGGKDCVEVWHLQELRRARFGGLQTCSSVWMCPVCAAKITERRKQELTAALIAAKEWGLEVVMVTYTQRHHGRQSLDIVLGEQAGAAVAEKPFKPAERFYCVPVHKWPRERKARPARPARSARGLLGARQRALGGRAAQELYRSCGVIGSIRALEVTWGAENGWHPHVHELLFVSPGADLAALEAGLRAQWENGLRLAGCEDVNEHGMELTCCDVDIAAYVEKFGRERSWNVEHELTKQPTKKGREGRFTPTELLRSFLSGDTDAGERWKEYAKTMKGARQLFWSEGLHQFLLPAVAELTDQQVAEDTTETGTLLALLDYDQWRSVLRHNARAQVLNIAATGDRAALDAFLLSLQPLRVKEYDGAAVQQAPIEPVPSGERCTSPSRRQFEQTHDQEEAAELGLSVTQYRLFRRGGINIIATPMDVPARKRASVEDGRVHAVGKDVIQCEMEIKRLPQPMRL
jgi:hypothetical protein